MYAFFDAVAHAFQVFALIVVIAAFVGVIVYGVRDAFGYNDF